MTCAACAVRVEKKLSKLDGVTAAVNYATGTARVTAPSALPVEALTGAVETAGYTARPAELLTGADEDADSEGRGGTPATCGGGWWWRWCASSRWRTCRSRCR